MRFHLVFTYLLLYSEFEFYIFAHKLDDKLITSEDKNLYPFSSDNLVLLLRSISSVYRSIEFFDSVVDDLDIDSLLGVRIVDDQLRVIRQMLGKYESRKMWTQMLANSVRDLKEQTESLLSSGLEAVRYNDPKYFEDMGPILEVGLWSHIPDRNLSVNGSKKFDYILDLKDIPLNENTSDLCVSQMLSKCLVSDECFSMMTEFGYQDYPLSHQVFYWQMNKMKCGQQISGDYFNHLMTTFCSNMFWENKVIELNGFPQQFVDLFMENIAFCGLIGFKQFTEDHTWLQTIVAEQKRFGCYGKPSVASVHKRRDQLMTHGCSSHKTSMALASTIVFIRDMISDLIDYTFDARYGMH